MSRHVYSEIHLHIIWHTKTSLPMIQESIEQPLYQFIKNKVVQSAGAYFHAIGGIEDHIHLAASIEPSLHLDEWIGQLKGVSSYEFGKLLQWQTGYGIVSFSTKDLPWVIKYINNQREHHKRGTDVERLERTTAWEGR